jgi:hypothetical protein
MSCSRHLNYLKNLGLFALACSLVVPSMAAERAEITYERARSFVATATHGVDSVGRYAVLVDIGGDNTVDHGVIYQAGEPLDAHVPGSRSEFGARLTYSGDRTFRRVELVRISGSEPEPVALLEIDGVTRRETRELSREIVLKNGRALAIVTGYALWPDAPEQSATALVARGLPTFAQARTEHIAILEEEPELGDGPASPDAPPATASAPRAALAARSARSTARARSSG